MNDTQTVRAITNAIMSSVPTVVVRGDEREWVSVAKVKLSAKRWLDRFSGELGRALEKAAVEIEGKTESEIRVILVRTFNSVLARHVKVISS
jgi:hypothetical protein